ncbi:hypothetical protein CLV78_1035 [Aliiruegeria haliotis]|uniref:Uncharacterized protein n=1 Tax=Aliiruegeria haliotis TaxID=1280846 RepID=A0A2T0RSK8_9RHOB|nr:hypothetical protein [Aliiruegeria haliotis]PRY24141.1 hypothetical protein CLV78_1035 [Aliiruegeria haliotis]
MTGFAIAKLASIAVTIALSISPAHAVDVRACHAAPDHLTRAWNIAEPWEAETRTYANGAVRLAVIDTIEPALGAFHLMILSPPFGPAGSRTCTLVSANAPGIGFAGLSLEGIEARYDPAAGLSFVVSARRPDPATGGTFPDRLTLLLNQATGTVTVGFP